MQGENERQWKKVNGNTYDISSSERVTKKFLEVSRCSPSSETQGQIVGERESLNVRKNMARRKVKNAVLRGWL